MKNLFNLLFLLAIAAASRAQVPSYIPTSGLLAWYPLDSSLANAYGGPMNDGVAHGAVSYGPDRYGFPHRSYHGNGASLSDIPVHNFPQGNAARSVSLFFRLDSLPTAVGKSLLSWGGNAFGTRFGIFVADTLVGVEYVNGYVAASFPGDSEWHNITVTYPAAGAGSSSVKVYLDGVYISSPYIHNPIGAFNTDTGVWHDIGGSMFFGTSYSDSWRGNIDDAAVWDRELTPCEVERVANSGPLHPPLFTVGSLLSTLTTYLSYQWFTGASPIAGATNYNYMAIVAGIYKVVVQDSAGCFDTSVNIVITGPANGTGTAVAANEVAVYPNPSRSVFFIRSPVAVNAVISDPAGRVLLRQYSASQVDMVQFPTGVYFLSIYDTSGTKIKTERITYLGQ